MKPILECYGLSKSYSNGRMALSNLNLSLERGQIIGLLGPNGSGKTTLIKLINDLLVPTEGYIHIDGSTPGAETKKIVSYLPERTYLTPSWKVADLISYFEALTPAGGLKKRSSILKIFMRTSKEIMPNRC